MWPPPFIQLHGYEALALIGGFVAMVRTTKQWFDASQLEVEDRVQTEWTEKDLKERAGALRSAHGSAATVKTAASCRRNRRKAMMTKWWKGATKRLRWLAAVWENPEELEWRRPEESGWWNPDREPAWDNDNWRSTSRNNNGWSNSWCDGWSDGWFHNGTVTTLGATTPQARKYRGCTRPLSRAKAR